MLNFSKEMKGKKEKGGEKMTGREVSNPGDEERDVREFRTAAQVRNNCHQGCSIRWMRWISLSLVSLVLILNAAVRSRSRSSSSSRTASQGDALNLNTRGDDGSNHLFSSTTTRIDFILSSLWLTHTQKVTTEKKNDVETVFSSPVCNFFFCSSP
jgi:hypothetical protein